VSCTRAREGGWYEYQTAACLIQPSCQVRLQTTESRGSDLTACVTMCALNVCVRKKDRQYGSQGPRDEELFRHAHRTRYTVHCDANLEQSYLTETVLNSVHKKKKKNRQEERQEVAMVT